MPGTKSSASQDRLFTQAESWLFWALVVAYLIPVWICRYFPTQDGPVHLASSIILKDYGSEGTRFHEFFEMRLEPLPNWTAHLLLAGLMMVVPPLLAEKLLLTLYVTGFAAALRYFCGSFGENTRPCALVGLLFIYNRGLWLGFYNWDLSLVLALCVFGFWLWRRDRADLFTAAALALLLVLTYLTHLVGFLVAALGLSWFALTSPRQSWRNLGWAALAMVPAGLLTLDYFDRTGFFGSGATGGMWNQITRWFSGPEPWNRLVRELGHLDDEWFAHHVQGFLPMSWIALGLYGVLAGATLFATKPAKDQPHSLPPRWPAAVLALGFLFLYVLATDDLGEHGAFVKTRLAPLPPLLFLGWLAIPKLPAVRLALCILVVFVLTINLGLVIEQVETDNKDLEEYTAARKIVGTGHTLFVFQDTWSPMRRGAPTLANPLLHASQYYSLDGNLNLDNYQATVRYFPFRYRNGATRGRGMFIGGKHQKDADIILVWEVAAPRIPPAFQQIFNQGRLAVFAKDARLLLE